MDLFLKDRQNDRTFIIAAWMNRCSDSLAEREQAKRQLCHALERQWRNRVHHLLLTPLQYSFSHLAGQTWAVSTSQEWCVGIDAACNEEFSQPYPVEKVFHPQERSILEPAQVWSAKEAVVKAIGCGFDGMNPLDIRLTDASSATVAKRGIGSGLPTSFHLWSWRLVDRGWVTVAYQRNFRLLRC